MKVNLKTILISCLLVLFVSCNVYSDLIDGLVAHYEFDGDTSDSSGYGNDATAYNDYEYLNGVFSDAIRLVGSGHTGLNGGHVILPFIALDEFHEFTISMWVNLQGSSSGAGDSFIRFGATLDPEGNGNIVSICWETDNSLNYAVGEPISEEAGVVNQPYGPDFVGNWNHLALRADNGLMTAFLNGQSVGSSSYQLGSMSPVAGLGCSWFNSGGTESNRFIGMIDELRIYNRALSDIEVEVLSVPEPATLFLLAFGGLFLQRKKL
jgi:hypothetical protein